MIKLFRKNNIFDKLKKMPRYTQGTFKFDGFTVKYTDALSFYYEYKDIFQNKIYHINTMNKTPYIIDAGGCIGMSTLYFKQQYPDAEIIVFEPDPHVFKILDENITVNSLNNITTINKGLGKGTGIINFYADGADGGSVTSTKSDNTTIAVEITKLSEYLNKRVDLLKMNIEGMEFEVFEEISDKLHNVHEIIFEYHAFHNLPQTLGKILEILDTKGFRYLVTDGTSSKIATPFIMPKKYQCFNLVYAKNLTRS
ncbi:MAG: FkbM family methyltransferase [bacterium]